MSRKKTDLRLKKRAESSVSCDTPPSGIQDSESSRSFSAVSSLSAQNRVLLHRLLLGKQKMSPFPASQLTDSSSAVDSSPEECPPQTEVEEEFKWTPLPAPDIATLVGQLAPVRLSMEQLCAPLTEKEGAGQEQIASSSTEKRPTDDTTVSVEYRSSSLLGLDSFSGPAALPKECLAQGATSCTASASKSTLTQEPASSALSSQSVGGHHASAQKSSASNQRQDTTTIKTKCKSVIRVNPSKFSQPVEPKYHIEDVIDLTDSPNPLKIAPATTMNTSLAGCSTGTHSGRSGIEQVTSLTSVKEPVDSQAEDIDRLCMDVDIDTIEEFSDDDSDLGPSVSGTGLGRTHPSTAASTGGAASGRNGQSQSSLKSSGSGKPDKAWVSKGKSLVQDDRPLVNNVSGSSVRSPGSIHARHTLPGQVLSSRDSSSSLQSTFTYPTTTSSGYSSGQRRHTADSPTSSRSRFTYPSTTTSSKVNSSGQKRRSTTDSTIKAKKHKLDSSGVAFTNVTASHSGHKPGRMTHTTSTQSTSCNQVRTAPPTKYHTAPFEQRAIAESDPKPSTSWGAGSGGGGSGKGSTGGTEQTSQLETCPMCNTHFPAWYTQVDADSHIAQCLQAVMDLEMEHDLVLD